MMKRFDKIFAVLVLILPATTGWTQIDPDTLSIQPVVQQDSIVPFYSEMFAIARYSGDSVILRWSPAQAGGWHVGNRIGYQIERTELDADSTYTPTDFKAITAGAIKPWPLDDWQKIAGDGKDKYAAIAAQSLYGESFSTGGFLEQADEFKNRFSFALLSADFSPQTADALGLRFVDRTVQRNKVYVYRVFLSEPYENYTVDTAYQVVNTSAVDPLPDIIVSNVSEGENKISFSWDRNLYENYYTAYYIERSDDNRTFTRLNTEPFINALSNDFKANRDIIIYTDSVTENYETYYYRIRGLTPFGELSTQKSVIEAMGRDRTPPTPPILVKPETLSPTEVKLTWQKEVAEEDLLGYIVSRSQEIDGTFAPLFTDPLPKTSTTYIDRTAVEYGTNYYKVSAVDTAGNLSSSLASFAMMIDSIPPAQPQNFMGKVDSTGIVKLQWSLGEEKNLKGYNIYYSNSKDHVFTTLNDRPIQDTVYVDTIQVKTLTEEIFYFIKALDVNFSLSESSDTLELARPDLIAPTVPTITNYFVDKQGITIKWQNSTSKDAVATFLYRKEKNTEYVEIARFDLEDDLVQYKDSTVRSGKVYTYALRTQDDAGLRSDYSFPTSIKMGFKGDKASVQDIVVQRDEEKNSVTVLWNYNGSDIDNFVIYRAVDGRNFKTYKTVDPQNKSFTDHFVKPDLKYEYAIKVRFNDGRTSAFGKIVSTN